MAHEVYYQFPQELAQSRRAGARGGKATARNRRQRREGSAAEIAEAEVRMTRQHEVETTAAAIALLEANYPWLRGAEKGSSARVRVRGGVSCS